MKNYKIVTDSSANILSMDQINLGVVPLHIIVGDQEFIDDETLDLGKMQTALSTHKGKTSTSCPNAHNWIDAFDNSEVIFCVTITSGLSGSCASANTAKEMYEQSYPDRKVYVIDSLSTGPEMVLIIRKIVALMKKDMEHEEIYNAICAYQKKSHLYFSLASVDNLAKNGRVNPLVAKGVGILGIRILGIASEQGTLEIKDKARGDKKAFKIIAEYLRKNGYTNGRIELAHNNNEQGALELRRLLIDELEAPMDIDIRQTRGLCSYYAEPGSFLIGYEA